VAHLVDAGDAAPPRLLLAQADRLVHLLGRRRPAPADRERQRLQRQPRLLVEPVPLGAEVLERARVRHADMPADPPQEDPPPRGDAVEVLAPGRGRIRPERLVPSLPDDRLVPGVVVEPGGEDRVDLLARSGRREVRPEELEAEPDQVGVRVDEPRKEEATGRQTARLGGGGGSRCERGALLDAARAPDEAAGARQTARVEELSFEDLPGHGCLLHAARRRVRCRTMSARSRNGDRWTAAGPGDRPARIDPGRVSRASRGSGRSSRRRGCDPDRSSARPRTWGAPCSSRGRCAPRPARSRG